MTENFSKRLACLNVVVRELTGDMQLTKKEILETQVIVTTPEKWDVITRKSSDVGLAALVRLLIIDEVHLLNEDRGQFHPLPRLHLPSLPWLSRCTRTLKGRGWLGI